MILSSSSLFTDLNWYDEYTYMIVGSIIIVVILGVLSNSPVVKTNYSNASIKDATVYYYLPQSILKIRVNVKVAVIYNATDNTLTNSSKIIEQSFTATTEIIADTRDLLSLNYKSNAVMHDEIKYGVNQKGLLETVNITTKDKSATILSSLSQAPQIILGLPANVTKIADTTTEINTIVKIKEFTIDYSIKVSKITNNDILIPWQILLTNELGKDEYKTIDASFNISSPDISSASDSINSLINETSNSSSTEIDGILTRPLKNVDINISPNDKELKSSLPINLIVADTGKLVVIPVKRTPYVERINRIGIQDGVITSNEITNPSSIEGFISIPINIAKAIVSIPAQLIQFRYNNITKLTGIETAKLLYETSIQTNTKFELGKEQAIREFKLDQEKKELTNKNTFLQEKLDLLSKQTELEKKLLEAQKNIEDLKQKNG